MARKEQLEKGQMMGKSSVLFSLSEALCWVSVLWGLLSPLCPTLGPSCVPIAVSL